MRRDIAPRRGQAEDAAGTLAGGSRERGGYSHDDIPLAGTLGQRTCDHTSGLKSESDFVVPVSPTLRAGGNSTGGDRPPGTDVDTADSLIVTHSLRGGGFDASEDGTPLVPVQPLPFDTTQIASATNRSRPEAGDPCHPLAAGAHAPAIAFDCKASGQNGFGIGEIASTLRAMGHAGSHQNGGGHQAVAVGVDGYNGALTGDVAATMGTRGSSETASGPTLLQSMQVRRLTPRECERLQGFPDDYTLIPWRKKYASECPDGLRYKALGNSWAVPVVRWIGERIAFFAGGLA